MDWDTTIKTVTAAGFIVSATAWLVKEIIKSSLEKDTIQFTSNLER